jgi:acetoacetate decarboxylase
MRREDVIRQPSTPLGAPAFPRGPYRFTNREYLNILYRSDRDALDAVVPEPLEVSDPLVRFEVMSMPDVTGLGSYTECGQVVRVQYEGEQGDYLHAMYVDNHPAIASGRERSAFPKKLGSPRLYVDSDTLVGTLDYGTLRVAAATMGYKLRCKSSLRMPRSLLPRSCSRSFRATRAARESASSSGRRSSTLRS